MTENSTTSTVSTDIARQLMAAIEPVFAAEGTTTGLGDGRAIHMQGRLLTDSEAAYDYIAARFKGYGYTALLRRPPSSSAEPRSDGQVLVIALPLVPAAGPSRDWGAVVMFVLTVVSVLYMGAWWQGTPSLWPPTHLLVGLPFAVGLLAPLITHEAGHYLVSRRLGVATSLPYFIPFPSLFGTLGAVISTRERMRNRRQALAIGSAGPLAGLVIAIPLLIVGLLRSTVQPITLAPGTVLEGNSILYAGIKFLIFGRLLPGGGLDVFVHPLALGAWAALFVTGLNLLPASQLDGGHVADALFGDKTAWVSRIVVVAMWALMIVSPPSRSLWLFALLLTIFGQWHTNPLDDVTPLSGRERLLAIGMLLIFVLVFVPVPMTIIL